MDNEFEYNGHPHQVAEAALSGRHHIGRTASGITNSSELDASAVNSEIPLLTYGQEVDANPRFAVCISLVSESILLRKYSSCLRMTQFQLTSMLSLSRLL